MVLTLGRAHPSVGEKPETDDDDDDDGVAGVIGVVGGYA